MAEARRLDLLVFNLATDEQDPILGFAIAWIAALSRICRSIDVITMSLGRADLPANVRAFSVGKERGYSEPRRAWEFDRLLAGLLRRKSFDACLCHMVPWFAVLGAPRLHFGGVRSVLWYAHRSTPTILRVAERLVDVVVTSTRESFPLRSDKLRVVGQGIDTERFRPGPPRPVGGEFNIVCVGRLSPIKGADQVVEAVRLLVERRGRRDIRLRLVGPVLPGDEAHAAGLRERVNQARLSDVIEFAGPLSHSEIASAYHAADLVVSASRTRSADKVVLEAMACGVPVLTTNPAFAPLLSQWPECYLTPAGGPQTLADGIERFESIPAEARAALGTRLRSHVEAEHGLTRLAELLVHDVLARRA